jgi:hypothetical protein
LACGLTAGFFYSPIVISYFCTGQKAASPSSAQSSDGLFEVIMWILFRTPHDYLEQIRASSLPGRDNKLFPNPLFH